LGNIGEHWGTSGNIREYIGEHRKNIGEYEEEREREYQTRTPPWKKAASTRNEGFSYLMYSTDFDVQRLT
jgi:hypothetical protein